VCVSLFLFRVSFSSLSLFLSYSPSLFLTLPSLLLPCRSAQCALALFCCLLSMCASALSGCCFLQLASPRCWWFLILLFFFSLARRRLSLCLFSSSHTSCAPAHHSTIVPTVRVAERWKCSGTAAVWRSDCVPQAAMFYHAPMRQRCSSLPGPPRHCRVDCGALPKLHADSRTACLETAPITAMQRALASSPIVEHMPAWPRARAPRSHRAAPVVMARVARAGVLLTHVVAHTYTRPH